MSTTGPGFAALFRAFTRLRRNGTKRVMSIPRTESDFTRINKAVASSKKGNGSGMMPSDNKYPPDNNAPRTATAFFIA